MSEAIPLPITSTYFWTTHNCIGYSGFISLIQSSLLNRDAVPVGLLLSEIGVFVPGCQPASLRGWFPSQGDCYDHVVLVPTSGCGGEIGSEREEEKKTHTHTHTQRGRTH